MELGWICLMVELLCLVGVLNPELQTRSVQGIRVGFFLDHITPILVILKALRVTILSIHNGSASLFHSQACGRLCQTRSSGYTGKLVSVTMLNHHLYYIIVYFSYFIDQQLLINQRIWKMWRICYHVITMLLLYLHLI